MIVIYIFLIFYCLGINVYLLFKPTRIYSGPILLTSTITCIFSLLVPLDLALNIPIRRSIDFGELVLDEYSLKVVLMYTIYCISLTFMGLIVTSYFPLRKIKDKAIKPLHSILNFHTDTNSNKNQKIIFLIVCFAIVLFCLDFILISTNISDLASSYKHARIEARSSSGILSLLAYAFNILSAMCSVAILYAKGPKDRIILYVLPIVLITSLYYSQISNIVIWLVVYFIRFAKQYFYSIKKLVIFSIPASALLFLALKIKLLANFIWLGVDNTLGSSDLTVAQRLLDFSKGFSSFEGLSAFEITRYLVENKKAFNSFEGIPLLDAFQAFNIFNRFDSSSSFYVDYIRGIEPGAFSFSPLAEAYLSTNSILLAPVISALILISIVYLISASNNKWLILILVQYILRFNRLDLYSSFRRYFVVELLAVLISLMLIKYFSKIKFN